MKSAVIMFPGSNCDRDMAVALESVSGQAAHMVWHGDNDLPSGLDVIAIPGGFSYGDYLRCGAMASQSHIIPEILKSAQKGVKILGVCNGFQILTEIGLLPGALMRNRDMNFICRDVALVSGKSGGILGSTYPANQEISLPVAHHDGNFFADDAILNELEDSNRVAFRYAENINGSSRNIAGIVNEDKNVLGMMPHPERAIDPLHGGIDGRLLFEALYAS